MVATAVQDVVSDVQPARRPALQLAVPSGRLLGSQPGPGYTLAQGTLQVLEGQPAGWLSVGLGTVARAGLIAGGFYLTGTRAWKPLLLGSLAASGIVTVVLFAGHAVLRKST